MNDDEWSKIFQMIQDKHLYSNLVNSLFPTIHGNDEVKRGILLMLFGGVPKTTEEGTALRGDINVCIVGDPSTAKSQFLKQVCILLLANCRPLSLSKHLIISIVFTGLRIQP